MNNFYLANTVSTQNFLGCAVPSVNWHVLPRFQPGVNYHVSWFPTRMDTTALPQNYIDTTGNGYVTLDMSSSPLGGIANNFLDTLHADYAFIISVNPVHRSQAAEEDDLAPPSAEWDFTLYPNPANDVVFLFTPDNGPKEISIYDLQGRRTRAWNGLTGGMQQLPLGQLAKGTYFLRVSEGTGFGTKKLIIH